LESELKSKNSELKKLKFEKQTYEELSDRKRNLLEEEVAILKQKHIDLQNKYSLKNHKKQYKDHI
jgi:hypothetical protein